MKLSVGSFFGSFNKSSKKKKSRSITCSDTSFASTATSSSSSDKSTSSRLHSTPRSVLRPAGKPPLAARSNDLCLLSPASSSVSDHFAVFDCDGDGKITPRELKAILRCLSGADPPTKEVALMVADVDCDGDGGSLWAMPAQAIMGHAGLALETRCA